MGCLFAGLIYAVIWVAFLPLSFCVAAPYILLRADSWMAPWPEVRERFGRVWSFWLNDVPRYMHVLDIGD